MNEAREALRSCGGQVAARARGAPATGHSVVSERPRIVGVVDAATIHLDDGRTANLLEQGARAYKVQITAGQHSVIVVVCIAT